ncbi:hypothetical protein HYU12_03970 [Candidatus Woesearchaeota archaeon]|nr:hypothetical protein [Candidatus Woesearchaeota archaeon]
MNKEQVLQQLGLTEAEVKLYTTLLSIGDATASELARKTATNRTFTYDRLAKLVNIGLVSHIVKDRKKYFKAAEPSQFLSLLKERETQLIAVLPELEALRTVETAAPKVTVFSSRKGVQTALNLILKEKKQVFMHGSLLKFMDVMAQGFELWNKRREREKVSVKFLTPEKVESIRLAYAEVEELPEEEKAGITTFTFGNKVVIAFWSDVPVAILIESREIAKNNIAFFNTIWNREVKIYSGVDGIVKAFYELIADRNGYFLGVGYSWALAQVYGTKLSNKWHEVRLKNNVSARLISYDDYKSVAYFNRRIEQWKKFHVKFLSPDICGPACVTVSDNLMATFIYTEGSFKVIVNKNKEAINAYKKHFERLWGMAKRREA